ncbi:hypothetical protein F0L68_21005 [Solihabitans fulvus]|uniref:Uncharacterized protein n=1 Tax=Solihabitans fulvus TaxID=1892852 RepID=A0A5B2X976_9PSEU|nr:hypothetical protein [Solihabitans fulvus]KAA2259422.1 hypothetical protein F0L68_21005 [Solihabitans fulvus]
MLCATRRPLAVSMWLAVPLLFAASVLTLTALAGAALGGLGWHVSLSVAVFGAATAVTAAVSDNVSWAAAWQRRWLRWPYLAVVLAAGVALDGVRLPTPLALAIGMPATVLLVVESVRSRRRVAEGEDGRLTTGCGA